MKIINPATEEVIRELDEDTPENLDKKFHRLQDAQPVWGNLSLVRRVEIIRRFAALLAENIEDLATVLTTEVGKPLQQSRNELNGACSRIQWLADHSSKYLSDEIMASTLGMTEKISYEPLGVVCNISAWNYPYLVGTNVFIPALLAGNAVLYKPSEYALLTGLEIDRVMQGLTILATQSRAADRTLRLVADYAAPNVSVKVLRIIVSYTDYVNRTVWKK